MFDKTFHFCAVGLAHVSIDGKFIRVNKKLCEFLGYSRNELTQRSFQELTAPDHLHADLAFVERLLKGEVDNYSLEKQYVRSDGELIWGKLTVSLVSDGRGNPEYFIFVIENIDEKKRIETELFKVDALFSKIVSAFSPRTFIWVASPDLNKLHYVNNGYINIYGRNEYELYCSPTAFIQHIHHEDKDRVKEVFDKRPLESWDIQYRICDVNGKMKYLHDRGSLIYNASEQQSLILGTADDITKEKEQQEALIRAIAKLEQLSKTDALTGLANRREILTQLTNEIRRMQRGQKTSSLVYLDLNNFKHINDMYGHKVGDKALLCFSQNMKGLLRESDRLGRIGGDEFVILLYDADVNDAKAFLDRILNSPIYLELDEGNTLPIAFSFGCVEWNPKVTSVQAWLDLADKAMYEKKRKSGNGDSLKNAI